MAKGITKPMYFRMLGISLVLVVAGFIILAAKLFSIQIINYKEYQQKAIEQQTRDITLAAKRGTIFDRNGKEIAVSATAYMVYVNPRSLTDEQREIIASYLSQSLGVDKDELLEKCSKKNYYEILARRIEQQKIDEIKAYFFDKKMSSKVSYAEDPKRYYPYNNFGANVIGFTGADNQGLSGLEAYYNEYLSGTPGRIITATDAKGNSMPITDQMYISPQDGYSLTLTIDEAIQHYLEKYLEKAVIDNKVLKRGAGIVMDVTNGEILAMSVKPDYNLNDPYTITDPNVLKMLGTLKGDELKAATGTALQEMWRNKAVNDQYMPGSVYKTLTASYALEENVVKLTDRFVCTGHISVDGWGKPIGCDKRTGHGPQDFVQGFYNSCNPVFITVGLRVGIEKTCKYTSAFGLNKKTGIDLPGEGSGIVHNPDKMSNVDLATQSFGQNIKITPIQMITAIASTVNGGSLIKPTMVKTITDSKNNVIKTFTPEVVRQTISSQTSSTVCGLLENVVLNGSGRNARIEGYRIGGKTGTSEKIDEKTLKRVVSFVAVAPMDAPKIAILIMLDEPDMPVVSGGMLVAPVVKNVLTDVLPYMGIEPKFTEEQLAKREAVVPNLVGLTSSEAIAKLAQLKINYKLQGGSGKITAQLPEYNKRIPAGGNVLLYSNNTAVPDSITVPDINGLSASEANTKLVNAGLNVKFSTTNSTGLIVAGCSPNPGSVVTPGTTVTIELKLFAQSD